jgi:hypothetical protein
MIALLAFGLMGLPLFAAGQEQEMRQAVPGTVNYVEGAVYLNGSQLNSNEIGNATLEPGQQISTGQGKAEILLTPGVFLRLDDNSSAKMISPDLTLTQVEIEKGRAGVEVDEIHDQNNLEFVVANVTTRLDKRGYYEFDADKPAARVFKGEAHVEVADGKWKQIKGHHEFALNDGQALASVKPVNFDEDAPKGELYNWSSLRSQYMAEANNQMAAEYQGPYAGPGWYWDPWALNYAYVGVGPFASPFGWGFYPFGWGGGYWGGYYGHPGWYGHGYAGGLPHGYVGGAIGGGFGGFHGGGGFAGGRR